MLIAIIGENCVGKTTIAEKIKDTLAAKVYSGKDYLRLEKNPNVALEAFKKILTEAVDGENIIYVVSEQEYLKLLPEGAKKIVVTAPLSIIKERFKERMHGNLPKPVEDMLEKKHGMFDNLVCDVIIDTSKDSIEEKLKIII